MKLYKWLENIEKMVREHPEALQAELIARHGASGAVDEMSYPSFRIARDGDDVVDYDMVQAGEPYISVYIGN